MLSAALRRVPIISRSAVGKKYYYRVIVREKVIILQASPSIRVALQRIRANSDAPTKQVEVFIDDIPVYCDPNTTVLQVGGASLIKNSMTVNVPCMPCVFIGMFTSRGGDTKVLLP